MCLGSSSWDPAAAQGFASERVAFSSLGLPLLFQVAELGCANSPLRKAPGSGACPAETAPCVHSRHRPTRWGWRGAGLAPAQHKLVPTLPSCEGFGQLKQQRQSKSLAPRTAWCCAKRKGKNNNPPAANHRPTDGTGCGVLFCIGQGGNQTVQLPRLPQTPTGCAEAGAQCPAAAEGQAW